MSEAQEKRRRVRVDDEGKATPPPEVAVREPVCECPHLDAEDWHEVESDWSDIQFLKASLPAVAGVPVGYANVRKKLREQAEAAGATVPDDAMLLLGEGRVKRPVLLEVEAEEGTRVLYQPGGFAWSRLLPAHFGAMKTLAKETRSLAKERYGREPDSFWIWYLTCAECSQERDWETLFVAHYAAP